VLVFLLFAHECLLRGEGHHRHSDAFIDPVVDDARGLTDQVKVMPFRDRDEGDAEKIVLGHDFTNIETIMIALHTMNGRTAARMLGGECACAAEGEITRDHGDYVRKVIGQGELIEFQLTQKLAGLSSPFGDNLFLTFREDSGEVLDRAVLLIRHNRNVSGFSQTANLSGARNRNQLALTG
jgi:hypothetical protein